MNRYLKNKFRQKKKYSFNPDINEKKCLVIMACHCNSSIKLQTIRDNLNYFSFNTCRKIVINSTHTEYTEQLTKYCEEQRNTNYYEVKNDGYIDFGKWVYTLTKLVDVDYNDYDYVILTNDSYTIHHPIDHFLNIAMKCDVELFGYNDSNEIKYHYQSYLFILRKDAVKIFIHNILKPGLKIHNQNDVIMNFELQMTTWFTTHKCFLQIARRNNKKNNIFFENDKLYESLKNTKLLPFTKLKRLQK